MASFDAPDTAGAAARVRALQAGAPTRVTVQCGELTMTYDPLEFYVGQRQVPLSPLQGAILELLILQGRASSAVLLALFEREGAQAQALDVHVYRIRRKFLDAGFFDPIETVRGWGLKLNVEAALAGHYPRVVGL